MLKISAYLNKMQGIGIRLMLLVSFIAAVIFSVNLRIAGTDAIPYAQMIADQMLPIKIENSVIVEPVDTVRKALIDVDGVQLALPIILDTNVDNLDTSNLKDGVYITKTAVYSVNKSQIRINKFPESLDLPQADYTDTFKSFLNWIAVFAVIGGTIGIFITFLLLSLFYTACSYALTFFMKKPFEFDLRMRVSAASVITIYILLFILGYIGVTSGALAFFLLVMLLEYFIMSYIPSPLPVEEKPVVGTENKEEK